MHRIGLLLIFGLMFCSNLFAQKMRGQERVDSLLIELPKAKEDTNRVAILNSISSELIEINPEKGFEYCKQGFALAKKIGWQKGQADHLFNYGSYYFNVGDYPKTIEYYTASEKKYKTLKDTTLHNNEALVTNIASCYNYMGNLAMALEYYQRALSICESKGMKLNAAIVRANIGTVYSNQGKDDKALEYMNNSLIVMEKLGFARGAAVNLSNIGGIYQKRGDYEAALINHRKALKISRDFKDRIAESEYLLSIGSVLRDQKKYEEAIQNHSNSMAIAEEMNDKRNIAKNLSSIGQSYMGMAKDAENNESHASVSNTKSVPLQKAVQYLSKGVEMSESLGMVVDLQRGYKDLSEAYKLSRNYKAALEAHEQYLIYKDSVFNKENTEKITRLELEGDYRRKQLADSLKNIEVKKLNTLKLQKQKTYTYIGAGAVLLLLGFSFFIVKERSRSEKSRKQAEGLLLNILPEEVSNELKERGAATAKQFDEVTVLFTDFVNFTSAGERMGTQQLVEELHTCFKEFDTIMKKYGIEKIKTIGDAYLAVSGLPVPNVRHAENIVHAAMEIRTFMADRRKELGENTFEVRIGVHSGPVVAGIVGVMKFAYDIWGDTVNTAARMEQKSLAGKINISQTTYDLVKDKYRCTYRGEIEAKNKGMLKMYFVDSVVA